MADDVRDRMIRSAMYVLAREGYQGASFSAVLAHSQAPRGSIYYHFPGGKDELVAAAVEATRVRARDHLEPYRGKSLPVVLKAMSDYWRDVLELSDCTAACPIVAVSVGATNPQLQAAVAEAFTQWRAHYRDILEDSGLARRRSGELAAMLLSGFEGAMHVARAQRSLAVYDESSRALRRAAVALSAS